MMEDIPWYYLFCKALWWLSATLWYLEFPQFCSKPSIYFVQSITQCITCLSYEFNPIFNKYISFIIIKNATSHNSNFKNVNPVRIFTVFQHLSAKCLQSCMMAIYYRYGVSVIYTITMACDEDQETFFIFFQNESTPKNMSIYILPSIFYWSQILSHLYHDHQEISFHGW